MQNKIVPSKIVYTSKDGGEIKLVIDHKIELELTINIEGGVVNVKGSDKQEVKQEEKVDMEVPDFSDFGKLNFGKKV